MKKKAIEKIPFLTIPRMSKKRKAKYIGVTAWKNLGGERHIFLEVYRNEKQSTMIPVVRYVATKKDWGIYCTETGAWTRQQIINYWNELCWYAPGEYRQAGDATKYNQLLSTEDLVRIKNFFKGIKIYNDEYWWNYFERNESNIKGAAAIRKQERRQQALKDREAATPELPETSILDYADQWIFMKKHYLYYKKKGRKAAVACSACGGVSEEKWKAGESYESQLESLIQEPIAGRYGNCPMCGARGKYMAQGKMRGFYEEDSHIFIGQKYKETGMVFRYVQVSKRFELQLISGEKGPEMYSSREVLSGIEIARAYFEEGKKVQIDYHKHNPYEGKDFWDDCNLYGMANISVKAAKIMPETYHNMKGTILQYSALQKYQKAVGEVNPFDYMERYLQTPQIEMLVKLNLIKVVEKLVRCHYGIVSNVNAKRPDEFLGIRKGRVKFLEENQGDEQLLKVMQMEKQLDQNWTDKQIKDLAEIWMSGFGVGLAMKYMTVQKLLNRIAKYAGCEFGTGCTYAEEVLRQTAITYFDYLDMRQKLGYNLENTVYQQPRDLLLAHNKMVMESNKGEMDKRCKEVSEKFPLIRKHYRSLRKKYFYEDDEFLIRPARSAEEIVMEGRILHHCVGGNDYLGKHNNGVTIILLLRLKKKPEVPYVTIEIDGNNKIIQWYGANDKKPDEEHIAGWLKQYVQILRNSEVAETAEIPLKVTA